MPALVFRILPGSGGLPVGSPGSVLVVTNFTALVSRGNARTPTGPSLLELAAILYSEGRFKNLRRRFRTIVPSF